MKRIKPWFLLLIAYCISSCNMDNKKSTSNVAEVLSTAPYKTLTDSINNTPADAALLLRRAELLTQNEQHEIAYPDYKKSWDLQPNEQTALLYTSNLFLNKKTEQVIDLLKKCIRQYPDNIGFMRRLSEVYAQTDKPREALALYDEVLKRDSTNYDALYEKGILFTKLKDTVNAIATLEKSYALQPVMQNGLALANLYAEIKNDKTIALCDALEQKDTTKAFIEPIFLKAVYYANIKNFTKAIALFDLCINKDWKFIEPYLEKGIIFYKQKNYDEAIKTFQFAVTVNYANPDAYYWIGKCCEAIGKKEEALDYYHKALVFDRTFTEAKEAIERLKKM